VGATGEVGKLSPLPDAPLPVPSPEEGDSRLVGLNAGVDISGEASSAHGKTLPAFDPAAWSSSTNLSENMSVEQTPRGRYVPLKDCPADRTHARECRMHWGPLAIEAILFNAFDNGGNVYTGYWYRHETLTGKWWDRYVASVEEWRWTRWSDNNPVLDDYVGHPMMGAITNSMWNSDQRNRMGRACNHAGRRLWLDGCGRLSRQTCRGKAGSEEPQPDPAYDG
jgi:hypothetical protein